jgi:MFS family permease
LGGHGQPRAAAASTPLIGRLADLHDKKRVLLSVLVIVLVGSVLAATTTSLALLVFARVSQGVSYALYPICVAILRDELPRVRSSVRSQCCPARWASAAEQASS